jgi:hypothetical protein
MVLVDRVGVLEPTGNLLGRPLQQKLAGHDLRELSIPSKLAILWATGSLPPKPVGLIRPITLTATISPGLPANSGRCTSKPVCYRTD